MTKKTRGTKEWAVKNVNILLGCPNECGYCYAERTAKQYKRISTHEEWADYKLNLRTLAENYSKKADGIVMYPTSHDITEHVIVFADYKEELESLKNDKKISLKGYNKLKKLFKRGRAKLYEIYGVKLKELLAVGNEVLIVSKLRMRVAKYLANILRNYKDQVEIRATITAMDEELLKEHEPNAPTFVERLESIKFMCQKGFKVSVSIEPFLEKNPIPLIQVIAPYVNSIWLGIMSVDYGEPEYEFHTKENVGRVIERIKNLPSEILDKIRLKDAVRNMGFRLDAPKIKVVTETKRTIQTKLF